MEARTTTIDYCPIHFPHNFEILEFAATTTTNTCLVYSPDIFKIALSMGSNRNIERG
jgi:hypothetical protein